jgi:hypothetical protein
MYEDNDDFTDINGVMREQGRDGHHVETNPIERLSQRGREVESE